MLMIQIRKYYEDATGEAIETERYNFLSMSPVHIFRDKKAHTLALLTLGDEIVSHIHHRPVHLVTTSSRTAGQNAAADH